MIFALLSSVAGWLVNRLLGSFFPAHPKITPEVVAQAQKDRADVLAAQKRAGQEAVRDRQGFHSTLVDSGGKLDPGRVYQHDANERND